jgi:hypothetical protein
MAELALCHLWRGPTFEEQRCVYVPESVEPGALDLQGIEQRPELEREGRHDSLFRHTNQTTLNHRRAGASGMGEVYR